MCSTRDKKRRPVWANVVVCPIIIVTFEYWAGDWTLTPGSVRLKSATQKKNRGEGRERSGRTDEAAGETAAAAWLRHAVDAR